MRLNLRTSLVAALALTALAPATAARASWSTPTILFQDAGSGLFAAAGDPSGRAFLVAGGAQPDVPLVLTERIPALDSTVLNWLPGRPLDGSDLPFSSSGLGRSAIRGAAGRSGLA